MNNRIIRSILTLVMLCIFGSSAFAQSHDLVNVSYDPKADSIFFAKMQKKMAKIRSEQHRPTVALVLAGGGAKGASHIGVLKYLEEKGIRNRTFCCVTGLWVLCIRKCLHGRK